MDGNEVDGNRVGVIGATMVRGERGGDVGGVVVVCMEAMLVMEGMEAESGLQESLRRQLWFGLDMFLYSKQDQDSKRLDLPFTAIEDCVGGDGDLSFAHSAVDGVSNYLKIDRVGD